MKLVLGFFVFIVSAWIFLLALQPPTPHISKPEAWQLSNVTVVQPNDFTLANQDIIVRDGVIAEIKPTSDGENNDEGVPVLASNGFLLPGLIDLHVHYPPAAAIGQQELWSFLFLRHGVTGIRILGDIDGSIFDHRESIRAGKIAGPSITTCGPILDGNPAAFPSNYKIDNPNQAEEIVRELAATGVDCIKVYTKLEEPELRQVQATAKELGLPIIGHLPHAVSLEDANLREIQHLMGIPEVDIARAGFNEFSYEDWLELNDERLVKQMDTAREKGIAFLPTLFNTRQRELILNADRWQEDTSLRHLPIFWAGAWNNLWSAPYNNPEIEGQWREWVELMQSTTHRLEQHGVQVLLGTDSLMPYVAPGSSMIGEIEVFHDAGFPIPRVLELATSIAGERLSPQTGRIEVGMPADLVLYNEDPTQNLSALSSIRLVSANKQVFSQADLDSQQTRYDAHFLQGFYPAVMNQLINAIELAYKRDH